MEFTVGIDPGLRGGIVVLNNIGEIIDKYVMPEYHVLADRFDALLKDVGLTSRLHVWLEKAQSMPKNGGVAMFNYGTGYGTIIGILIAMKIPHTLVPPKTWTRMLHQGTKDAPPKERSLEAVKRLRPGETFRAEGSKASKPHDGLVDAYLIAEYGRRQFHR